VRLGPSGLQRAAFTGGAVKIVLSLRDVKLPGPQSTIDLPAQSFSLAVKQAVSQVGGGAGAGKVTFENATIKRVMDKNSPVVLKDLESGRSFEATVSVVHFAGSPKPLESLTFTMKLAFIASDTFTADQAGTEEISIAYGGLTVAYK
jgi:type VI secretion system secreted protein Hcp